MTKKFCFVKDPWFGSQKNFYYIGKNSKFLKIFEKKIFFISDVRTTPPFFLRNLFWPRWIWNKAKNLICRGLFFAMWVTVKTRVVSGAKNKIFRFSQFFPLITWVHIPAVHTKNFRLISQSISELWPFENSKKIFGKIWPKSKTAHPAQLRLPRADPLWYQVSLGGMWP